jgi:hypothetical protein
MFWSMITKTPTKSLPSLLAINCRFIELCIPKFIHKCINWTILCKNRHELSALLKCFFFLPPATSIAVQLHEGFCPLTPTNPSLAQLHPRPPPPLKSSYVETPQQSYVQKNVLMSVSREFIWWKNPFDPPQRRGSENHPPSVPPREQIGYYHTHTHNTWGFRREWMFWPNVFKLVFG